MKLVEKCLKVLAHGCSVATFVLLIYLLTHLKVPALHCEQIGSGVDCMTESMWIKNHVPGEVQ